MPVAKFLSLFLSGTLPCAAQFIICAPTNRRKFNWKMEKTPDIVIDVGTSRQWKNLLPFLWCHEKLIYHEM
jgi:hypothetical protein